MSTKPFIRATILALAALCLGVVHTRADSEAVYFWVGHRFGNSGDGYVLPLCRSNDVAAARAQLEIDVPQRLMALARIIPGGDGINRNLIVPGKPRWSWHVIEFQTFFEVGTPELTAGYPTTVEQDVELWMEGHYGLIGFGEHVVMSELTPEEIFATWVEVTPEGVEVRWLGLGTKYVYTVEIAEPATPMVWGLAPGAWPITGTNWVDTAPAPAARYYRVRAEKPP